MCFSDTLICFASLNQFQQFSLLPSHFSWKYNKYFFPAIKINVWGLKICEINSSMPHKYNFINHLCCILEYLMLLQHFTNCKMKEGVKPELYILEDWVGLSDLLKICSSFCFSIYREFYIFLFFQLSIWMFFYSPHHKNIKLFLSFSEQTLRSLRVSWGYIENTEFK